MTHFRRWSYVPQGSTKSRFVQKPSATSTLRTFSEWYLFLGTEYLMNSSIRLLVRPSRLAIVSSFEEPILNLLPFSCSNPIQFIRLTGLFFFHLATGIFIFTYPSLPLSLLSNHFSLSFSHSECPLLLIHSTEHTNTNKPT